MFPFTKFTYSKSTKINAMTLARAKTQLSFSCLPSSSAQQRLHLLPLHRQRWPTAHPTMPHTSKQPTVTNCYKSLNFYVSPYLSVERRVPELIPVLGSQPAGDVSHRPSSRLPLLSTRPAVTLATLKRAATNFAAW